MTKPEFDRLYNEKIARGLNFPLDDLYESLVLAQKETLNATEFLMILLAHQLAQNCLKTKNGNNIYINRWQISVDAGQVPSIDIRLIIS